MADGASSSTTDPPKKYDVFISCRGEDTRNNFTSHLYAALCRKQVKAYIDENDLKRGDEISPALLRAIQESKLCLIILSKNYASSTWCLDELAYILHCKGKHRQEILPIFYNVDPSHVRKQQESYAAAFVELEKRFKDKMDKVQAWRDALKEVGSLSGWASSHDRCESQLVDAVVEEIIKKLNHTSSSNYLKGLVGVNKHINQIISFLRIESLDVRIIGIWGMGGIGKTTLARAVFNQFSSQFEACSFLANVREESEKHGLPHLEKKLFSELLEEENLNPVNWPFAKERLLRKKVLIVLDDVNDAGQLEQLVGDWFGLESRIIITSRDKQVLRNIEVHGTYKLEGLCHDEALELFCLHAFKSKTPTKNKIELSERVVNYAGGIPLALKVLGCHLYSTSKIEWESTLDKLKKFPNKKIHSVLRISYDALDDSEKDIFLDIACFFKGENKNFVENILNSCGFHATIGIKVLIDKSLITLDYGDKLGMHGLLQVMGIEIVRVQSNEDPRKGSRLWRADDIFHALKYNTGIEAIEGISLDTTNVNEEIHLSPTTISKMCRSRLLIIINGRKVSLSQGPLLFPDTLTYLCWHACPLKSLTNFIAKKLVELDMRGSKLEQLWAGIVHLENLRSINLSNSRCLTQVPDLSQAPNIERINLNLCDRLIELPSSFQQLDKLEELKLMGCSSLCTISRLPNKLRKLKVLTPTFCEKIGSYCRCCSSTDRNICLQFPKYYDKRFDICSKFEKFPEILKPMESLEILELDYTAIKELPLSIEHLIGLKRLSLRFCPNLEFLPNTIHKLNSLKEISLVYCRNLKSLPVLPLSLYILEAYRCTSLEKMSSISRTLRKQNWDDFYTNTSCLMETFLIIDCGKLDGNSCRILMDEAQFRIFRFATLYSKYISARPHFVDTTRAIGDFSCCWTGSEIPRWFIHQSDGSSISINLPPFIYQWYNRTYLGLAICLVLEFNPVQNYIFSNWNSVEYEFIYTSPNGNSLSGKLSATCSDCYCGWYYHFCQDCSTDFTGGGYGCGMGMGDCKHVVLYHDNRFAEFLNANKGEYHGTNENGFTSATATATASFSFKPKFWVKVKKCGVHLLYAQEAEKFGFVQPYNWEERQSETRLQYRGSLRPRFTSLQSSLINNVNIHSDYDMEEEDEGNRIEPRQKRTRI